MTDKRYQVFVSSTYEDLIEERREVTQAVLELDCIPAGMEMFVASDAAQWELIKEVIELSDYYVLIVGGRYGSRTADGISYTETEFNYALELGKPVLAFVHENPDDIPQGRTDGDDKSRELLGLFRARVMTDRTVAKFSSADDLGSKVSRALNRAIRKTPGVGWIRGDSVSVEAESEILRLRAELAESREKSQTLKAATTDTGGAAGLSSGDDSIDITLNASSQVYGDDTHVQCQSRVTWNDILRTVGPSMIDEATEEYAEEKLAVCAYYGEISDDDFEALKSVPRRRLWLFDAEVEQVFVHLRTLGIIESGNKRRPVSDRRKYLRLTELGRATLEALMAVKKETDDSSDKGDSAATADGDGAQ